MKYNVYLGIAIRIVILFTIAMFWTFIPEYLRGFFGDVPCDYNVKIYGCGTIDLEWSWGARHYWYFWMVFFLFILTLINIGMQIFKLIDNNYELE